MLVPIMPVHGVTWCNNNDLELNLKKLLDSGTFLTRIQRSVKLPVSILFVVPPPVQVTVRVDPQHN